MTSPKRVPRRRLGHGSWRRGYFYNSRNGSEYFGRRNKNWADNDGHLSAPDENDQCAWVRTHGAPETFYLTKRDRFEHHTWAVLSKIRRTHGAEVYSLDTARKAFADNHRNGLGTEWEVKNINPWDDPKHLNDAMQRLARHAAEVYGANWRRYVNVKVLTTWGLPYALRICRAAHDAGIPTLLSVRGRFRYQRFIGHEEITYVRGSLVIR